MQKIYDISPLISEEISVWPEDTLFSHHILMDTKKGDNISLSSIHTTLHLGAHTDAPNHYQRSDSGIDKRDLNYYLGLCQILTIKTDFGKRIYPSDLQNEITEERVLFRTNSFPNPNNWNSDFMSLSKELIDFLAERKVKLVGIDTPSIDPMNDRFLESHKAVYQHNMAILEGIVLSEINEGVYELIALPLKLKNADASPVRAILREIDAN